MTSEEQKLSDRLAKCPAIPRDKGIDLADSATLGLLLELLPAGWVVYSSKKQSGFSMTFDKKGVRDSTDWKPTPMMAAAEALLMLWERP